MEDEKAMSELTTHSCSLVTPLRQRHVLERQRFLAQHRRVADAAKLPCGRVRKPRVVALRLPVGSLKLFSKMTAARFLAVQRVDAHQLRELEEISHAAGLLQRLVQ